MGWLERLGLAPKKARPVGQSLEKGRQEDVRRARRKNIALKAGIFLVLVILTVLAFPRRDLFEYGAQVGEAWQQETLTAPFEFAIFKDPEQVEEERRQVRYRVAPLFTRQPSVVSRMEGLTDTLGRKLDETFSAYSDYRLNLSRGRLQEAAADSARFYDLRSSLRLKLTPDQWRTLVDAYAERVPGLTSTSRTIPAGPRLDEQLLQRALDQALQLVGVGVLNVSLDSVLTDEIRIRNEEENTEIRRETQSVFGLSEAHDTAQEQFLRYYQEQGRPELAPIANAFFRAIFQPSLEYMRAETLRERRERESRIKPTRGKVDAGELIVREGDLVTDDVKRKLASLEYAQKQRTGDRLVWRIILGQLILTIATYLIFFLYLYLLRRSIFDDNSKVLLIALLFSGIIALFALALRVPTVAMYAVPVAIVSVLLTVMFDSRVGLFGTIVLAMLGGHLLRFDFEFAFATFFAGVLGVFSVRDIKNRGQFFISAGLVFLGYLTVLLAGWLLLGTDTSHLGNDLLLVAVNAFLLIMAYPLLWVFERIFDITTDLTLLELSDTNRPLLKDLSLRAPGTFNHVLQVANLAEAAADAIGANALLARVGALYHDVGKMQKPEYFVENQRPGENPHDQLKPRMSALIIASHVKEGLEIARRHKLPQRVLDFIPMHHGTTRIEFFYRKACEERDDAEPEVMESEFRYPGPRPISKETGILMLADSVEAASRSLANPTHKRLEALIDTIFKARIEDGQLNDTDLTFQELTLIKETFLSMLLGIYHVRVKYPGQEEDAKEGTGRQLPSEDEAPKPPATPASGDKPPVQEGMLPPNPDEEEHPMATMPHDDDSDASSGDMPDRPYGTQGAADTSEEAAADAEPKHQGDGAPEQASERREGSA